jgi:hypothetical protein
VCDVNRLRREGKGASSVLGRHAASRDSNISDETSSIMTSDCPSVDMSEIMTIQRSTTTPCCRTTSHRTRHFQRLVGAPFLDRRSACTAGKPGYSMEQSDVLTVMVLDRESLLGVRDGN